MRYKIGITEAGDAGIDLSWQNKLSKIDGAILITKNITTSFIRAVLPFYGKVIVHATITGYGGSIVEPNVPNPRNQFLGLNHLLESGFPLDYIVIRVDPIIPTTKGIDKAKWVIDEALRYGLTRFRVSVLDLYPHVRQRFVDAGLTDPYNGGFQASIVQLEKVDGMLAKIKQQHGSHIRIESCAEPNLHQTIQCGCISSYDLDLLRLNDYDDDFSGYQRKHCMCYSGKIELLEHKKQCPHGCLYCYWK